MSESSKEIVINPKGCKGDDNSCSLVQTVLLWAIFLQNSSKKVQRFKEKLLEELDSYESRRVSNLSLARKGLTHIRNYVLKTILTDLPSKLPLPFQPDVSVLWKIMNEGNHPNAYVRKLFTPFQDVKKSVDLRVTFEAIMDLLTNAENGECGKGTAEAFGKCMGEVKVTMRCGNPNCRKGWPGNVRKFPFFMIYEPSAVDNFTTSMRSAVLSVLNDAINQILLEDIDEQILNCAWDLCDGKAVDQFACDEGFPEVFIAQINFIRDLRKERQAIITKNEIIKVNADNYAIVAKVWFFLN